MTRGGGAMLARASHNPASLPHRITLLLMRPPHGTESLDMLPDLDLADVTAVLLSDGWHEVEHGSFIVEGTWQVGASQSRETDCVAVARFSFECADRDEFLDMTVTGPITSIFAVRVGKKERRSFAR